MKYKVLIMSGLMLGGIGLLSCNQQERPQQSVEVTGNQIIKNKYEER